MLVACGPPPAETARPDALPESALARLAAHFPVLRPDSAPPPAPHADARPDDVPDRLRGRLPARALASAAGEATFYADRFEGRTTASGVPFRQNQLVAAHRAYPFGTVLRVTNTRNDRSVNVRVVDRGPFGSGAGARRAIIDLSRRAAERLGFAEHGRAPVRVEVLEWGDGLDADT